jgi:3' terminal RNA ribose 2'-O-methyltransferase Hen1
MLLTITTLATPQAPATDLGYLLHKHPARLHSRPQAWGTAHVFYPQADEQRCTAALYVDVDPVGLVRGRKGLADAVGLADQYVNDRPYAASSLLCAAMAQVFGSAMNGSCSERPELVSQALPLELHLPVLPCRGGEGVLRSLFEPLGHEVQAERLPLDPRFPGWGASSHHRVTLRITATLQAALSHLYVLVPVLDNSKHYWVNEDEVDKLLRRGEPWLATHPQRELIVRRYLKHKQSLAGLALERLVAADEGADGEEGDAGAAQAPEVVRGDEREQVLERPLSLNDRRLDGVAAAVQQLRAASVIDLGCGEGRLLRQLLPVKAITRLTGVDVSHRALEIARERLNLERLPQAQQDKLSLLQGSLTYRDARFAGYDAATLVEVVEHLDAARLGVLARVVFECARPRAVIVTTPNREYNARFPGLAPGQLRHADHRFEWTRAEFQAWAGEQALRFGYGVRFVPVGGEDAALGPPTQMAVFTVQR